MRVLGLGLFAVLIAGFGIVSLAVAVDEALDAYAFRTAEPCRGVDDDECVLEERASVARIVTRLRGTDYVYLGRGDERRVTLVENSDYGRLDEGDRVVVRRYRGDDIALLHEGRELRTTVHPNYGWGLNLWIGYWFTSLGGFMLAAVVVTRGRPKSLRRSHPRMAAAAPFLTVPGCMLLLALPFGPTAMVLAVLTALAAAVTVGGGVWAAARAD